MLIRLSVYEKAMPDVSWEDKFATAKRVGFDGIELSIDESDVRLKRLEWDNSECLEMLRMSRKYDVSLNSICLSGHRRFPLGSSNKETENHGMLIMNKAIRLADALGIHTIQLAGYDVYYDENSSDSTRERFTFNLGSAVRYAASFGIVLGIETMETTATFNFLNTVEKAMNIIKTIDSPYLQIYPDIGNLNNATENVIADIEKGSGHIIAAHLKETVPGVFRNMIFGTGNVNFSSITAKLLSIGVTRYTAEFWYRDNHDWQLEMIKAHDFCRKLLNENTNYSVTKSQEE